METKTEKVTITTRVNSPLTKVWNYYTEPAHIVKWNTPSPDWHTTHAENDLRVGGRFLSKMAAKDGSFGFDFSGSYDAVENHKMFTYSLDDGRKVVVSFENNGETTEMIVEFETETQNSVEMQRDGWQSILNNFKNYTENN